jgi:predicted transcriptional regulator
MPKSPETARHEVHLDHDVVKDLKEIADRENRSLKNLMETVLIAYAKENKKQKKQ